MRYLNSLATPALYDAIDVTPGPVQDDPDYLVNGSNSTARPGCPAANWARPAGRRPRLRLLARPRPHRAREGRAHAALPHPGLPREQHQARRHVGLLQRRPGAEARLVRDVGPRPRQRRRRRRPPEDGPPGLVRRGHALLRRAPPRASRRAVEDPALVVQTSDGSFRAEEQWPPADAQALTVPLNAGEYTDDTQTQGHGRRRRQRRAGIGLWTISPPLPARRAPRRRAADQPRPRDAACPDANLAAAVYDIDPGGKATLVLRQGSARPRERHLRVRPLRQRLEAPRRATASACWSAPRTASGGCLRGRRSRPCSVTGGTSRCRSSRTSAPSAIEGGRALRLEAWLAGRAVHAHPRDDRRLDLARLPAAAAAARARRAAGSGRCARRDARDRPRPDPPSPPGRSGAPREAHRKLLRARAAWSSSSPAAHRAPG